MENYSRASLMKIAIHEQSKCSEFPKVGSVISKDRKLLSTGYKGEIKGMHAERVAIEKLSKEDLLDVEFQTKSAQILKRH